jgi:hypothetical protein
MENKLDWQPAFPEIHQNNDGTLDYNNPGMSKRFYAVCSIIQGFLSNPKIMEAYTKNESPNKQKNLISGCYDWADELLKQEHE